MSKEKIEITVKPSINSEDGHTIDLNTPVKTFYVKPKSFNPNTKDKDKAWEFYAYTKNSNENPKLLNSKTKIQVKFKHVDEVEKLEKKIPIDGTSFDVPQAILLRSAIVVFQLPSVPLTDDADDADEVDWRFEEEGIIFGAASNYKKYNFSTEVVNFGKTLILTIDQVETEEFTADIEFRLAVRALKKSASKLSDCEVYISQDPRIEVEDQKR